MKFLSSPGPYSAHWFQFFNAISFQIMMGAPIIVFAKTLGASSTVLGIIAAFTPLMTIFQLPAAQHLERYGYRQFVLAGWGIRSIFIFVVAAVPVLAFLDNDSKMAILLAALFIYNLLRGISSVAFMPWIVELVPEHHRGRFLSIDQLFTYFGFLLSLLASGFMMIGTVDPWEFSLVFLISAFGGTASIYFIKKIPEAVVPEGKRRLSSQSVPWGAMLKYLPFRELLVFNFIQAVVVGSLAVFTIEFLRSVSNLPISEVLFISSFAMVGSLLVLPSLGGIVDTVGSKPLLRVAVAIYGVVIALWFLLSAQILPSSFWLIASFYFLTGVASANFNLANVRITMSTMPEMGRNHFFALFTVFTSLGLGISPVMWGLLLDLLGSYESVTGALHWKRHSIYFAALLVLCAVSFLYISRLHESPGAGRHEPSLIYGRLKRISRLWHR